METDVIGLKITDGLIKVEDLYDWITDRDAACAEYLAPELRNYIEEYKEKIGKDKT